MPFFVQLKVFPWIDEEEDDDDKQVLQQGAYYVWFEFTNEEHHEQVALDYYDELIPILESKLDISIEDPESQIEPHRVTHARPERAEEIIRVL